MRVSSAPVPRTAASVRPAPQPAILPPPPEDPSVARRSSATPVTPPVSAPEVIAAPPASAPPASAAPAVRALSLRPGAAPLPLTLESALMLAIAHSSQVQVFADLPLIRRTAIVEAAAAFDWSAFLESRWDDRSDPVGSTLTTGTAATRYLDERLTNATGLRKRTRHGGQFELAQRSGWQQTNSSFFVPNPQGTARLSLSYTHPLLRGAGRPYNESLILLAAIDTEIAHDEFLRQLQSHLLEVTRAYWGLNLERENLLVRRRSHERAEATLQQLRRRAAVDAVAAQVARADAETATRRSQWIRAEFAVRNAESRMRTLVDAPDFGQGDEVEIVPVDVPVTDLLRADVRESLAAALRSRPEVGQVVKQIKAASVRLAMSKQEMLPVLNLVTETYVAGLQDRGDIPGAWTDQFSTGRPSYAVGLQFEMPLGNRAAIARNERRRMELRQLEQQYRTTVQTLKLEVEVAVREVFASHSELDAHRRAAQASQMQLDYQERRWQQLPGEDHTASLFLDNLLAAQERLAQAEFGWANSLMTYNLALMHLRRATGELLQAENVHWHEGIVDGTPKLFIEKHPQ